MMYNELSNKQFVKFAYQEILGRNADEEGLNFYTNQLSDGQISRAELVTKLFCSDEKEVANFESTEDGSLLIRDWKNKRDYNIRRLVKNAPKNGCALELGVYKGQSASIIRSAYDNEIYLFDTFNGFPSKYTVDGKDFSDTDIEELKSKLPECNFIEGDVRDTTEEFNNSISFIHFDLDTYEATIGALENLYDLVESGGILLFDQYAWKKFEEEEHKAVNEFLSDKPESIVSLRTGQAFFIKN